MHIKSLNLKYNEILGILNSSEFKNGDYPEFRIAFLSNITIEGVINYLKYFCYTRQLKAVIYKGDYDNIFQEAMKRDSGLYRHRTHIIILAMKIEFISEKLIYGFSELTGEEIENEVKRISDYFNRVISFIRENSPSPILLHNFETILSPPVGILDYQNKNGQINTIRKLNLSLIDVVRAYKGVYIVDTEHLQCIAGYKKFIDSRYFHMAGAPWTREASSLIAFEYMKFINALRGKNKKCIVLDCDNTLWKGILGEDGFNGIEPGKTCPGSFYREFQKGLLELYNRGIMLALCSKNNEEDVLEVLEKHPDMVLRRKHFILLRINWKNKADNIREIAEELNIGTDSIVFIDDNPFETDMVRKFLPEVETMEFSCNHSDFTGLLFSSGFFDSLSFSEEDRKRNEMYRAELDRKKAVSNLEFSDLEGYYRYLEMEVTVKDLDDFSIPRISQMTQKTNQFNLTVKRYSEGEIEALCRKEERSVRYLTLKDRFGDMGIVGVAILKYSDGCACIDTFLLSCRALGRGVEDVLLKDSMDRTKKKGYKKLTGIYIPTGKNGQVKDFYKDRGFRFLENKDNSFCYVFSLEEKSVDYPGYFKSINTE